MLPPLPLKRGLQKKVIKMAWISGMIWVLYQEVGGKQNPQIKRKTLDNVFISYFFKNCYPNNKEDAIEITRGVKSLIKVSKSMQYKT